LKKLLAVPRKLSDGT